MGRAVVKRLAEKGYQVRVLALPGDPLVARLDGTGAEVVYGDIADPLAVNNICKDVQVVLHLAAIILSDDELPFDQINIMGTRYLLTDADNHGVEHFIYVSSASVVYAKMTPYSRSKRIAERYVRASRLHWTIIRPTLVYGETGGLEFDLFLNYLDKYPVIPFIGSGRALKRPVYVGDLIDGFERVIALPRGMGKVYNFSGGSPITMVEFARLCLLLMGKEHKPIVHLPFLLCLLLSVVMKRVLKKPLLTWNVIAGVTLPANLDPTEAEMDLGYAPRSVEKKLPDCFPRRRG